MHIKERLAVYKRLPDNIVQQLFLWEDEFKDEDKQDNTSQQQQENMKEIQREISESFNRLFTSGKSAEKSSKYP